MARKGRKIKINGQMRSFEDIASLKSAELSGASVESKLWRYKKNGDIEFFDEGDMNDDDIVFGGSKSDLRRLEDIERNISVLANKTVVVDSDGTDYDSDDDNFDNVFNKPVRFKKSAVRFTNSTVSFDGTSTLNFGNKKLSYVAAPVANSDAATKGYVDSQISSSNEISELTDVTITSASTGQILKYNGSAWVNTAEVNELNELTGVTISSPSADQILKYNGSAWINADNEGGSGTSYTASAGAPSSPNDGDEWFDTDDGNFYKYINDGTTKQWVEWSPGQSGPTLDGTVAVTGDILPDANNTRDLGSTSNKYAEIHATTFYGTATTAQYADLAEMYAGDTQYDIGTVVVVGGTHEITACTKYAQSSLAGVVSDRPGFLLNDQIEADNPICVGFVGRVPVKVVGHVEKGDLLTTSEVKGFATKYSSGSHEPGCIIGVALDDKTEPGEGTVEVLLKRS